MKCLFLVVALFAVTLGASVPNGDVTFKLRLLHTNDMHARFDQVSGSAGKCSDYESSNGLCYGGFPRVKTALLREFEKAEKENVTVLSLNAGDTYQGTVWYAVFKYKVVLNFLKKLKIDAMSLGNHEFDDGIEGLTPFLNGIGIPVLAANIDLSGEPEMNKNVIKKSIVIERGGKKIGIIGYITPETVMLASTGNLKFKDEIESLKEESKKLKAEGIDIIIALGHSGYEVDIKIGKEVEDIDVIVGGHSHTFLYTGTPPDSDIPMDTYPVLVTQKSGRKVAMVQAYAFTKYLGILDVTFDSKGEVIKAVGNPILLNSIIPEDPELREDIEEWRKGLNETLREHVGVTKVYMDGFKCRFYECNLGNMITDAYIRHAVMLNKRKYWTMAPIAIQQAGGIRGSINATATNGNLTKEDLITVMPFFSPISVVRIKGKYLLEALEWSVARYDSKHLQGRGEFLQVSGIRVMYDLRKPSNSRVVSLRIRCGECYEPKYENFQPNKNYTLVMPTFLLNGGDHFGMFKEHGKELQQFVFTDTDIAMDFAKYKKVLYDGEEDRIIILNDLSISSSTTTKSNYLFIMLILFMYKFI